MKKTASSRGGATTCVFPDEIMDRGDRKSTCVYKQLIRIRTETVFLYFSHRHYRDHRCRDRISRCQPGADRDKLWPLPVPTPVMRPPIKSQNELHPACRLAADTTDGTTKMLVAIPLILAFSTLMDLTRAATTDVLDIDGMPVQVGVGYHILPADDTQSGGLTGISEHGSCPFNVMLSASQFSNGTLLNFHPLTGEGTVQLGMDLNIQFFLVTFCVDLSVWKLAKIDKETKQRFVTLGGLVGHPGPDTVDNWFKIEEEGEHYKLVFCPTVCDSCSVACGNVGTYPMNGKRWLALGDPALAVKFVRGSEEWSIKRSINSR